MKIKWNAKYSTKLLYGFILVAASILFYLLVSGLEISTSKISKNFAVLKPFLYGFIIAYLVNSFLDFFEKSFQRIPKVNKIKKSKLRVLSLLLAYIVPALFICFFIVFVLPQLVASISGLISNIPYYTLKASEYLEKLIEDLMLPSEVIAVLDDWWANVTLKLTELSKQVVPNVLSIFRDTALSIWNVILGIIVSIYILSEKERFMALVKKVAYGTLGVRVADKAAELTTRANKIFSGFIVGKVIDSLVVGFIAFIVLSIVDMPYNILISFIITITNIIPFFGPFIGAIPSAIIIFFESPIMAFWFLIIILVLQQLDGNYIGPKVLGITLGISPFWILFSIMVSGKVFGFAGLIIGVPLFVFIYSIVKEVVEYLLMKRELPIETEEYIKR